MFGIISSICPFMLVCWSAIIVMVSVNKCLDSVKTNLYDSQFSEVIVEITNKVALDSTILFIQIMSYIRNLELVWLMLLESGFCWLDDWGILCWLEI